MGGEQRHAGSVAVRLASTAMRQITAIVLACLPFAGCVERTVSITSDPPGARVWMNDREVGTTPCVVGINDYGTYDVRIVKEGYAADWNGRSVDMPLWDAPGPDLVGEILPVDLRSRSEWHVTLVPLSKDEAALIERARAAKVEAAKPPFTK